MATSDLGWSVVLRHRDGWGIEIPVDDQTVAYEVSPYIRALCEWLAPASTRISIAGSVVGAAREKGEHGKDRREVQTGATGTSSVCRQGTLDLEDGPRVAHQLDTRQGGGGA